MKTLIVYASKSGYSRECALRIASGLAEGADVADVKIDAFRKDLSLYDTVILGGGIRAGRISGNLRRYCTKNKTRLANKRIGLFLCGTDPDNRGKVFDANFPTELLDKATEKGWFGGRIVFSEQKGIMRFILKKIVKGEHDVHAEQPKAVEDFIAAIEAI